MKGFWWRTRQTNGVGVSERMIGPVDFGHGGKGVRTIGGLMLCSGHDEQGGRRLCGGVRVGTRGEGDHGRGWLYYDVNTKRINCWGDKISESKSSIRLPK